MEKVTLGKRPPAARSPGRVPQEGPPSRSSPSRPIDRRRGSGGPNPTSPFSATALTRGPSCDDPPSNRGELSLERARAHTGVGGEGKKLSYFFSINTCPLIGWRRAAEASVAATVLEQWLPAECGHERLQIGLQRVRVPSVLIAPGFRTSPPRLDTCPRSTSSDSRIKIRSLESHSFAAPPLNKQRRYEEELKQILFTVRPPSNKAAFQRSPSAIGRSVPASGRSEKTRRTKGRRRHPRGERGRQRRGNHRGPAGERGTGPAPRNTGAATVKVE
ncbi:hypothetical protein SKAU_G00186250 [Synaphobranchus kaupii]|uniref:Uncharacterized protein n=1 Tax=Synaphobranchus kaupii TaxID=118154 RepID=A0A9Q1FCM3_SYNKA|nr:hypothetical protein SKAU_G00186250 [Synaphobranchus kaupii]